MGDHDLEIKAKASGDYAFCFTSKYSFSRQSVVGFDYDVHIDNEEGKILRTINEEKQKFLYKLIQKRQKGIGMEPDNTTDSNKDFIRVRFYKYC